MDSILRICVPLSLCVIFQFIEVLIVKINLIPNTSKKTTFHVQVHNSLKIESFIYVNDSREIYYLVDSCC